MTFSTRVRSTWELSFRRSKALGAKLRVPKLGEATTLPRDWTLDDTTDDRVMRYCTAKEILCVRNCTLGKRGRERETHDLVSKRMKTRRCQGTHIRTTRKGFNRKRKRVSSICWSKRKKGKKGAMIMRFTFAHFRSTINFLFNCLLSWRDRFWAPLLLSMKYNLVHRHFFFFRRANL